MSLLNVKRRAEGLRYEQEVFQNLDLRSMKGFGTAWVNCLFDSCQFDMADLRNSKFENCAFRDCSFRMTNFGASFFEDAKFLKCDLEQASFMGCHFHDGSFDACRMAYGETMFLEATVKGQMAFISCNLHGSNLDFREVSPGAIKFSDCNFWGARVAFGCAFWNSQFDQKAIRQFVALIARASSDPRLKDVAGEQLKVVSRAMDGRKSPLRPVAVEVEA